MLALLVYFTPIFKLDGKFLTWYYIALAIVYGLDQVQMTS